jgi:hypothetical protein
VVSNVLETRRVSKHIENLQAGFDERSAKLENLAAEIEKLEAAEKAAVAESLKADPLASAYQLGSKAQTAREKKEKLQRSREGLETERFALQAELAAGDSQEAASDLAALGKDMERLDRLERRALKEAGDHFERLGQLWRGLATIRTERAEIQQRVHAEQLRERSRFFNPEAAAAWDAGDVTPFAPVSIDFDGFIEQLVEAGKYPDEAGALGQVMPDLSDLPRLPAGTGTYKPKHKQQGVRAFYRNSDGELESAA